MWRLVVSLIRSLLRDEGRVYFGGEVIPYRDEASLKRGRLFR